MRSISPRLGGLCTALVVVAGLAGASPAMATVTTTHVTSPTDPTFALYDSDAATPQTIDVAGTSDGTTGDSVDIRCVYYGDSTNNAEIADNVPVNADGTFSVTGVDISPCDQWTSRIYAFPHGASSLDLTTSTGPLFGDAYSSTDDNTSAPGGHQLYDFYFASATAKASNEYYSASSDGFYESNLFDSSLNRYYGTWGEVAGLYNNSNNGVSYDSEIKLDGHPVYTPAGAEYINSGATGLPVMTYTKSINPSTGEATITETDPLVYCGDASGNITAPDNSGYPNSGDCPQFLAAPAKLTRTITEGRDGLRTTISDDWSSTDSATHSLYTSYDNSLEYDYVELPGEDAYTEHAAGPATLATGAPGTINVEESDTEPSGTSNVQGAITYLTQPDKAVFTSSYDVQLQYTRTLPATGALNLTHVYDEGFSRSSVDAASQQLRDQGQAPTVAITSPANGAVVSSDTIAVTGTASDNVAVTSLKVNGLSTSVNPDGTWSQTISGLRPGANTITAVATDSSGNSSQASETVVYSPPAVPSCTVPKVGTMTLAVATLALNQAGCTVGNVTSAPSSHVKKGSVLRQGTKGGSRVPAYYPVNLVISSGRAGKAHLAHRTVRVRKGKIKLEVVCPKGDGNPCNGSLKLRTTSGRHMTLGTHAFQTPAGKKRSVTLTLSKVWRKVLAKEGGSRATVYILARNDAGKAAFTKVHIRIKD